MGTFRSVLAVCLMLATAPTQAFAACNIRSVSGTWAVIATRHSDNPYGMTAVTTCWFVISRPHNLRIECEPDPGGSIFFAQPTTAFGAPWHQIVGPERSGSNMVAPPNLGPDTRRRFQTPNRCEWQIIDRNGIDGEYTVYFAPDMNALNGIGSGIWSPDFPEFYTVTFTGVRQ